MPVWAWCLCKCVIHSPHTSEVVIRWLSLSLYLLKYILKLLFDNSVHVYNIFPSHTPSHCSCLLPLLLNPSPPLFLETLSLTEPGAHQLARLAGQWGPRIFLSLPPSTGIGGGRCHPLLLFGWWEPKFRSSHFTISALPTKPSPQPTDKIFFNSPELGGTHLQSQTSGRGSMKMSS